MLLDLEMSFDKYAFAYRVLCSEGCNNGMEMQLYHREVQKRRFTMKVIRCLEKSIKKMF